MATTPTPNTPDYVRPEVRALEPARLRSRTLAAGTDAVHAAGETLLPKWPSEDPDFYAVRSTLTEVTDFYGRTLEASIGLLFGADPTIENLPEALQEFVRDATGTGVSLADVGRGRAHDILLDGLAGVLVDYPPVGPDVLSLRDAQERQLRAYAVPVEASQVLSWRTGRRGAQTYLTQLVLAEVAEAPDGTFGVRQEPRYRVLAHDLDTDVVTVAVYRVTEVAGVRATDVISPPTPIRGPRVIPFAVGYARPPKVPLVAGPPCDRLAWLNLGHYRVSADHRYMMGICHAPTIKIEGAMDDDPPKVKIGPNAVWKLTSPQTGSWLQADADALQSSERTMERQQQQMGALGMAFLARDKSAGSQETATGRRLDAAAEQATLGSLANGVAAMLTQVLRFAAAYMDGVDASTATVSIRPDYDATRLDAPSILALSKLAEANQITLETLLQCLKDGNVLPDGLDIEEEVRAADLQRIARLVDVPEPEPVGVAA
jgi:hypothetical protein